MYCPQHLLRVSTLPCRNSTVRILQRFLPDTAFLKYFPSVSTSFDFAFWPHLHPNRKRLLPRTVCGGCRGLQSLKISRNSDIPFRSYSRKTCEPNSSCRLKLKHPKKRKPNFLEICICDFPKIFREVRGSDSLTNNKFIENSNSPKNVSKCSSEIWVWGSDPKPIRKRSTRPGALVETLGGPRTAKKVSAPAHRFRHIWGQRQKT